MEEAGEVAKRWQTFFNAGVKGTPCERTFNDALSSWEEEVPSGTHKEASVKVKTVLWGLVGSLIAAILPFPAQREKEKYVFKAFSAAC